MTPSTDGWPFLVAPGRSVGHRTVLVPQFLAETGQSGVLRDAISGSVTPTDQVVTAVMERGCVRHVIVYRIARIAEAECAPDGPRPATADRSLGPDEVLRDDAGRPIEIAYGLVFPPGAVLGRALGPADLADARVEAVRALRRFLSQESPGFRPHTSVPVAGGTHPATTVGSPSSSESSVRSPSLSRGRNERPAHPPPAPPSNRRALWWLLGGFVLLATVLAVLLVTLAD